MTATGESLPSVSPAERDAHWPLKGLEVGSGSPVSANAMTTRPTPRRESQSELAGAWGAASRHEAAALREGAATPLRASGVASSTGPSTPVPGLTGMDATPDVPRGSSASPGD